MMRLMARSPGYAAAVLLAGTAALAAPAAARASAALPRPVAVPCRSGALITAIQQANSARSATLLLSRGCNYVLTWPASPVAGLPPVTGKIVVIGGHGTQISRDPSAGSFRILVVAPAGVLTLANVTVANGNLTGVNDDGGGILDAGTLVLRNVRLTGNTNTGDFGGALAVEQGAHATISGSELDGNDATNAANPNAGAGGAIFNSGDVIIDRSALARNTAGNGGAIATGPASTTRISRTVVTRNSAESVGGGISNEGTMVLSGDRVRFNQASVQGKGGGIANAAAGTVTLRFTVVTANTPDNCQPQGTIKGCQN